MRIVIFLLLLSSIANGQIINGSSPYRVVTQAASYSYLLDSYTSASAAWSLMKVKSDYSGYCIKVRRSSDNTTQDIGFVDNEVDTAAIISFVSSNSGYIDTWYDQSGNSRNLTQGTNGNQPRIVNAGTLYRKNGKVAMEFIAASSNWMRNTGLALSSTADFLAVSVHNATTPANNNVVMYTGSAALGHQQNSNLLYGYAGGVSGSSANTSSSVLLFTSVYDGGGAANADRLKIYKNGSQLTISSFSGTVPATATGSGIDVGRPYNIGAAYLGGSIQEIIIWLSDKSADRSGIESNINTRYTIY